MSLSRVNVSLVNMEGFDAQLAEVMKAVDANLDEVAGVVETSAKTTTAFIDRTGNLRKSIKKLKSKFIDGGYIVKASGQNRDKGYHAHLVEFGHNQIPPGNLPGGRVAARPFLRPAVEVGYRHAISIFRSKR